MPQGMSPLEYKRGKKVLRFDCGIDRVLIAGKEIIAVGNPDEGGNIGILERAFRVVRLPCALLQARGFGFCKPSPLYKFQLTSSRNQSPPCQRSFQRSRNLFLQQIVVVPPSPGDI